MKVYDSSTRIFEAKLSEYFAGAYVLTVCNATIGIMGVFHALGLSNSSIITTSLIWPGALSGIRMLNIEILYADIEEPSLTLDPDSVESLIRTDTRAILSADFLGYPCRTDKLRSLCDKYDLLLIHDAAGSLGSTYLNNYSGHFADVTIFSFGRNKPFSLGEGGCIVTAEENIFEQIHFHLAHQERQNISNGTFNPFALNTVMHPFAIERGKSEWERAILTIGDHQKKVRESLDNSVLRSDYFDVAAPNFYRPFAFIPKQSISKWNTESIPDFSNGGTRVLANNSRLKKYKILTDLVLYN